MHAGDVYDAPSAMDDDPFPTQWAESLGVPVLAVRGNHDKKDPKHFFRMADDITGRLRKLLPGLWIAGIGFAPKLYFDLPGETDLEPVSYTHLDVYKRQLAYAARVDLARRANRLEAGAEMDMDL